MKKVITISNTFLGLACIMCVGINNASARDIDYEAGEIQVKVMPGEPTQVHLPGTVAGGYRKKVSTLSLEHKQNDLVVFANDSLPEAGEAIIVRLQDGRSYAVRILRASSSDQRDDVVNINDRRSSIISSEEEEPAHIEKNFEYAPPTQVAGLMREMMLAAEFGKAAVPGYKVSEVYKGQSILNDGTLTATIERIYMGPNLWGYVLDATNTLDTSQKINPAAFRIDGTRAISVSNWELAPAPMNVEQQIAKAHRTKVYIVARARKS